MLFDPFGFVTSIYVIECAARMFFCLRLWIVGLEYSLLVCLLSHKRSRFSGFLGTIYRQKSKNVHETVWKFLSNIILLISARQFAAINCGPGWSKTLLSAEIHVDLSACWWNILFPQVFRDRIIFQCKPLSFSRVCCSLRIWRTWNCEETEFYGIWWRWFPRIVALISRRHFHFLWSIFYINVLFYAVNM